MNNLENKCKFEKKPKVTGWRAPVSGDYLICKKTGEMCIATQTFNTGHANLDSYINRELINNCDNYQPKK